MKSSMFVLIIAAMILVASAAVAFDKNSRIDQEIKALDDESAVISAKIDSYNEEMNKYNETESNQVAEIYRIEAERVDIEKIKPELASEDRKLLREFLRNMKNCSETLRDEKGEDADSCSRKKEEHARKKDAHEKEKTDLAEREANFERDFKAWDATAKKQREKFAWFERMKEELMQREATFDRKIIHFLKSTAYQELLNSGKMNPECRNPQNFEQIKQCVYASS